MVTIFLIIGLCLLPFTVMAFYPQNTLDTNKEVKGKPQADQNLFWKEFGMLSPTFSKHTVIHFVIIVVYVTILSLVWQVASRKILALLSLILDCDNGMCDVYSLYSGVVDHIWTDFKKGSPLLFDLFDLCIFKSILLCLPYCWKFAFIMYATIVFVSTSYNFVRATLTQPKKNKTFKDLAYDLFLIGSCTPFVAIVFVLVAYFIYYIMGSVMHSQDLSCDPLSITEFINLNFGILPTNSANAYISHTTLFYLILIILVFVSSTLIIAYGDSDDDGKKIRPKNREHLEIFSKRIYLSLSIMAIITIVLMSRLA